jgi:hypothetical protein
MQQPTSVISDLLAAVRTHSLPLTQSRDRDSASIKELNRYAPDELFPKARNGEVAYSALLLLLGDWEASHTMTDDDESPEGCYLHAIIHRTEPDPANSSYWWRKVGGHPLFPSVLKRATEVLQRHSVAGWQLKSDWDPYLFNKWCEDACQAPGSEKEQAALALQQAEWDLLFDWCAEAIA